MSLHIWVMQALPLAGGDGYSPSFITPPFPGVEQHPITATVDVFLGKVSFGAEVAEVRAGIAGAAKDDIRVSLGAAILGRTYPRNAYPHHR